MKDIDDKVFQYTLEFSRDAGMDTDPGALKEGINRHMNSARAVVTNDTLERIGHVHLSLIINTAARYDISLGEALMESVRQGSQPASAICAAVVSRKTPTRRVSSKPVLRLV
jgi:hypothetical protein